MSNHKHTNYNDDELAADIAAGEMTCTAIAKKHGLNETYVRQIAWGERRPERISMIMLMIMLIPQLPKCEPNNTYTHSPTPKTPRRRVKIMLMAHPNGGKNHLT